MRIDVYDTYFQARDGRTMHFDVLAPHGTESGDALRYAREWLASIGEDPQNLRQELCRFCHTEKLRPEWENDIKARGYYILKMENCPS